MHEYYVSGVKVSKERFFKIVSKLEMSNQDWEIDNSFNRTDLYILG